MSKTKQAPTWAGELDSVPLPRLRKVTGVVSEAVLRGGFAKDTSCHAVVGGVACIATGEVAMQAFGFFTQCVTAAILEVGDTRTLLWIRDAKDDASVPTMEETLAHLRERWDEALRNMKCMGILRAHGIFGL